MYVIRCTLKKRTRNASFYLPDCSPVLFRGGQGARYKCIYKALLPKPGLFTRLSNIPLCGDECTGAGREEYTRWLRWRLVRDWRCVD